MTIQNKYAAVPSPSEYEGDAICEECGLEYVPEAEGNDTHCNDCIQNEEDLI